jgi:hypothetical protein
MNKLFKIILLILFLYVGFRIAHYIIFGHTTDWQSKNKFTFLINKDSFQHIDTSVIATARGMYDAVETYHYYPNIKIKQGMDPLLLVNDVYIRFNIWKFDKFENFKIGNIKFRNKQNIIDIKLTNGEVIDAESDARNGIAYGYNYKTITVNTDQESKIRDWFSDVNFKGFIGSFNRISLSNEKGEHDIYYDFIPYRENVLFMIYKSEKGFFLIVIDSDLPIDRSVLKLLNL